MGCPGEYVIAFIRTENWSWDEWIKGVKLEMSKVWINGTDPLQERLAKKQ